MIAEFEPDAGRIEAALHALGKRGPDARGQACGALGRHRVTLLHTRLSIIDLDPRSNQPFERDGCILVFNGEVYNYRELRRELEDLGHVFETSGDTEVVLRAYLQWGSAAADRFEGMWALALLDQRTGKLFLSRDRFGEKPLFMWFRDGALYFASEVKALAALSGQWPEIDTGQIRRYLVNGYKSLNKTPATFFAAVRQLPAGTNAILDGPGEPRPERYWSLGFKPREMTRDEAVEGAREQLFRAVELRLRADVPLAFCLSGGVDSTALAAIATRHLQAPIHAFSIIDSDERYDESRNIHATVEALDCDHHVIQTSRDGFFERMEDLVAYHDSPVATISYYVHSFLSEAIAAHGYKIAVSGTAADELFTGYYDHYGFWLAAMAADGEDLGPLIADWRESYGAFVRNPVLRDPKAFVDAPGQRRHIYLDRATFNGYLTEPIEEDFEEVSFADSLLRNRMMNELFHEVVPVILHEDDLNSMRVSIENRSPYLDSDLCEFIYSVPTRHLIRDGYAKSILRDAVSNLMPSVVTGDKQKRGFNASILSLVDPDDEATRERLLAPGPFYDIVRRDAVESALGSDLSDNNFSKFLFSMISAKTFVDTQAGRAGSFVNG